MENRIIYNNSDGKIIYEYNEIDTHKLYLQEITTTTTTLAPTTTTTTLAPTTTTTTTVQFFPIYDLVPTSVDGWGATGATSYSYNYGWWNTGGTAGYTYPYNIANATAGDRWLDYGNGLHVNNTMKYEATGTPFYSRLHFLRFDNAAYVMSLSHFALTGLSANTNYMLTFLLGATNTAYNGIYYTYVMSGTSTNMLSMLGNAITQSFTTSTASSTNYFRVNSLYFTTTYAGTYYFGVKNRDITTNRFVVLSEFKLYKQTN